MPCPNTGVGEATAEAGPLATADLLTAGAVPATAALLAAGATLAGPTPTAAPLLTAGTVLATDGLPVVGRLLLPTALLGAAAPFSPEPSTDPTAPLSAELALAAALDDGAAAPPQAVRPSKHRPPSSAPGRVYAQ